MNGLFGATRTKVGHRHALITPDGHVPSVLPGFVNTAAFWHITPAMGANMCQLALHFQAGGGGTFPADDREAALYVERGSCVVRIGGAENRISAGGYAFAPAGDVLGFADAADDTAVTCFRKTFEPLAGAELPAAVFGEAATVTSQPFLGNPRALLQTLLPDDLRYDLAMNIFTYEPGATLPFVETHIMEHGLLMLRGQGIYWLEDAYYPVQAGDVIWMAPHCPQWFVAMGDEPASYLYYKNINRLA
jgi:(S)-ureidoglycine aminohydrolase